MPSRQPSSSPPGASCRWHRQAPLRQHASSFVDQIRPERTKRPFPFPPLFFDDLLQPPSPTTRGQRTEKRSIKRSAAARRHSARSGERFAWSFGARGVGSENVSGRQSSGHTAFRGVVLVVLRPALCVDRANTTPNTRHPTQRTRCSKYIHLKHHPTSDRSLLKDQGFEIKMAATSNGETAFICSRHGETECRSLVYARGCSHPHTTTHT